MTDNFAKIFKAEPDGNELAWCLIHDVCHHVLISGGKINRQLSTGSRVKTIFNILEDNGFTLKYTIEKKPGLVLNGRTAPPLT